MFLFLTGVQGSVVEFVILIPIQKLILKSVSLWSNLELELESLNILKCFLCFLFSDFIQIVFLLEYFFFSGISFNFNISKNELTDFSGFHLLSSLS